MIKVSQNKITIGIVLLVLIGYMGMSLVMPISANAEATLPIEERGVKNVILLIGDGMSFAQVTAARIYEVGPDRDGYLNMDTLDYTGYMSTHSLNSLVTDSAAAGTALATGKKTNNDIISQSPNGEEYKTILEVAKEKGKAVGIVSTAQITDATPAAFGAHSSSRKKWDDIAKDYLYQTQPDLLLGGGLKYWLDDTKLGSNRTVKELSEQNLTLREAKADDGVIDDAEAQGYTVVYNQSELDAIDMGAEDMVLGLFSLDHMSHEFERKGTEEPHIAHMTQKALEFLKKDPDGFFLMVEGARIDHAGHDNNITLNVHDTIAFDKAVRVALEFAEEHSDTLVIVTADHECGGLSVEWPYGSFPAKGEYIKDLDNESYYRYGIWTSNSHTAVDVPVMASGPFANHLTGRLDNIEIFGIMKNAMTHQNGGNKHMIVEYIIKYKDLWSFLSCCAILIGVIIALIEINYMRKSTHSELLMNLYQIWESDYLSESRRLLKEIGSKSELERRMEEYGKKQQKEYFIVVRVANYFEHIGHLVNRKYLKAKDIEGLMGSNVTKYYEIFEGYSEKAKKENKYLFKNFQELKEKIEKIRGGSRFR